MKNKALATLFFLINTVIIFAQGDLLINPVRVVFEGQKQHEDLNLTNIGRDTAVYMISFLNYRMNEDGSFEQLTKPDSTYCADKYLRLFPRKVVLPPNESQTIRLQFRKPASLKDGEYRSHIYFRAEKNQTPRGLNDSKIDSTKMQIRITPIFGISIPVIIRTANLSHQISLSNAGIVTVNDSVAKLNLVINRTGQKSAYGNIKVDFVPDKGKKIELGAASGIGIYPEITKRYFSLPIKINKQILAAKGKVIVRFFNANEYGGAELAKTEFEWVK